MIEGQRLEVGVLQQYTEANVLVRDLLEMIPADTQKLVKDAYKQHNLAVREAIRNETRLRLRHIEPGDAREDRRDTRADVPIRIEVGYPNEVARIEIRPEDELAARLAPWAHTIDALERSSRDVSGVLGTFGDDACAQLRVPAWGTVLPPAGEIARRLLATIGAFNLGQRIFEAVNEDILGVYRFNTAELGPGRLGSADYDESAESTSEIQLYWGVIGLFAQLLGVSVGALTVVVLTHELAHAFTHLGFDIDGNRWTGHALHKSPRDLVEGLAQYYTARVVARLGPRVPDGMLAYERLLALQPSPYHAHLRWIEEATPEAVRSALVVTRRRGAVQYEHFDAEVWDQRNRRMR